MKGGKILFVILALALAWEIDVINSWYQEEREILPYSEEIADVFKIAPRTIDSYIKFATVTYDGVRKYHISRATTPLSLLIDLGYEVSNRNKVFSTSPFDKLYTTSYIEVKTYSTVISEVTKSIPFATTSKGISLCRRLSTEEVEQVGVLGVMTQKIETYYLGKEFVSEKVIEETVIRNPIEKIITLRGASDTPDSVVQRGSGCTEDSYWFQLVNSLDATLQEKQWLKFTMKWESGCNAESNKGYYKGLFQWDPCLWYKLYPNDNIFSGEAQIERTLQKVRQGANPAKMWPAVYKKYVSDYGEFTDIRRY